MTGRDGDDPYRDWDAAYVLGSLGPVDRRAFEDHLRTCAECRAAVAELAGLPGLLRMVPPDEAAASGGAAGDDEVVELTSLARAARRDRRRRSALLAGAAAALVLLAGVAGALLGRPAAAPVAAPSTSAQVSDAATGAGRHGRRHRGPHPAVEGVGHAHRLGVQLPGPRVAVRRGGDVRAGARRRGRHEHGRRHVAGAGRRRPWSGCVVEHPHRHDPAGGDPGGGQ